MVEDKRESREAESGTITFASGDSGTSKDLITMRDEQTFSMADYVIAFSGSGSGQADVEFYDDEAGTGEGNLSGPLEVVIVESGDDIVSTGITRDDVENDLLVVVRNNDADVTITSGGYIVAG
jgi:hypothetical protein